MLLLWRTTVIQAPQIHRIPYHINGWLFDPQHLICCVTGIYIDLFKSRTSNEYLMCTDISRHFFTHMKQTSPTTLSKTKISVSARKFFAFIFWFCIKTIIHITYFQKSIEGSVSLLFFLQYYCPFFFGLSFLLVLSPLLCLFLCISCIHFYIKGYNSHRHTKWIGLCRTDYRSI